MVIMLASDLLSISEALYPLDRIRMQKAVFLISMRGPQRWYQAYAYRPYDWGPYSDSLTSDIRSLQLGGYLRLKPTSGRYETHTLSPLGSNLAQGWWMMLGHAEQDFLRRVRRYVTNKSFNGLLREVYAEYPQFATNSKFKQT